MFSYEVLRIPCQGSGGGCCGRKTLSWTCRQGGRKTCAERQGASHLVTFATIWHGSGRRSDTTLLFFFVRSQSQSLLAWRLCCTGYPGSFCRQPLVRSDLWGIGGFGRYFCCGRDGLFLLWHPCRSRPGLALCDADARGAVPGMGATPGLLAGFASLLNDPSRQSGRIDRCWGSSGSV